jgi:hypothetical protein
METATLTRTNAISKAKKEKQFFAIEHILMLVIIQFFFLLRMYQSIFLVC